MKVTSRYQAISPEKSRQLADDLCAWLRDYGSRRINSRLIDERRTIPPYVALDLGNRGVLGMQVEERYGGLGMRNRDIVRVLEQASAIDLSVGTWILVCLFPGIRPIASFGTDALKDEVLEGLARGRLLAGYGQTEPTAGTNFAAMQTRAVADGRGTWRVSGEKVWIGNSSWAAWLSVMAQDIEGGRKKGLSAFALPVDAPGVFLGRELLSMGMRGMVQGEVSFRDVAVDETRLLGRRGQGLEVGIDSMSYSRLAISATCIGAMKRAAQDMLRFAQRRTIATGRLLDHPVALASIGETVARIAGAEAVLYRAADLLDAGQEVPVDLFAVAKVVCSEFLWQSADQLVQVLGSRGYDESNLAPQLLRDARVTRIFEGTTEALTAYIGSQAISPRSDLHTLLRDEFGSTEIADQMKECVERVRGRSGIEGIDAAQDALPRTWQVALLGRAALWGVVTAALGQQVSREQAAPSHLEWARGYFQQACQNAATGGVQEAVLCSPAMVEKAVDVYVSELGEVEQGLPGEKHELDPLLRPSGAKSGD